MLNLNKERELAYVVKINEIIPIEGADRVELAKVGGWTVLVKKDKFNSGDMAIYFEIDSKVPEEEPFLFLESKHYKIKTQKYFKGKVISQGLLMGIEDFPKIFYKKDNKNWFLRSSKKIVQVGDFLTKELNVTYSNPEDNKRKKKGVDKYTILKQKKPALFKKPFIKKIYKTNLGKRIIYFLFGRKTTNVSTWPSWIKKTDEERVQNMVWILNDKTPWIATEKIDGTSTTFSLKRNKNHFDFYVCSRNVSFKENNKKQCFYDTNVYIEMAEKYHIEEKLMNFLKENPKLEWVTLQGETYGEGIQKRDYSISEHRFAAFNFITPDKNRWNSIEAKKLLEAMEIPFVPILSDNFILPDTVEELLDIATNNSVFDNKLREGIVFRSYDGSSSFKAVSNEFLLKYHNG